MSCVSITHHALKRAGERLGIKTEGKAQKRIAVAYERGKRFEDYSDDDRRAFLRDRAYNGSTLIYYNGVIYIFYNRICATTYPAPPIFYRKRALYDQKGKPIRNIRQYLRMHRPYEEKEYEGDEVI